jgi:deazaflavin-dependent oxidoreductase (nitroreductase family)
MLQARLKMPRRCVNGVYELNGRIRVKAVILRHPGRRVRQGPGDDRARGNALPIPRAVARFNRRVSNRLVRRIAGWMPMLGIVRHRGRTSGGEYETPVNVFSRNGNYAIALTYGAESDWARNVLAAGGCELRTRGRVVRLRNPHIVTDPENRFAPLPVRLALRLIRVTQHMRLDAAQTPSGPSSHAIR